VVVANGYLVDHQAHERLLFVKGEPPEARVDVPGECLEAIGDGPLIPGRGQLTGEHTLFLFQAMAFLLEDVVATGQLRKIHQAGLIDIEQAGFLFVEIALAPLEMSEPHTQRVFVYPFAVDASLPIGAC
jgi:hypothetical protein